MHVFVYEQGEMVIVVTFGGDPISKSPFAVGVAAPLDLSKIYIDGLESSELLCFFYFFFFFLTDTCTWLCGG